MKFSFAALASAMLLTSTAARRYSNQFIRSIDFLAIDGQKANKDLLNLLNRHSLINESQNSLLKSSFVF